LKIGQDLCSTSTAFIWSMYQYQELMSKYRTGRLLEFIHLPNVHRLALSDFRARAHSLLCTQLVHMLINPIPLIRSTAFITRKDALPNTSYLASKLNFIQPIPVCSSSYSDTH
jgi:hypothetical protein